MKELSKQQMLELVDLVDSIESNDRGTSEDRWEQEAHVESAIDILEKLDVMQGDPVKLPDGRVVEYSVDFVTLERRTLTVTGPTGDTAEDYIVDGEGFPV